MTATDELRRLLDERGVEWDGESYEGATFWNEETNLAVASEGIDGKLWVSQSITPAQAIAATLGRDQCNCHNISDFNPVDVFTCSECGSSFKVRQFKIDTDGILDDETEFEFVPMHCPWCGAKVVDE